MSKTDTRQKILIVALLAIIALAIGSMFRSRTRKTVTDVDMIGDGLAQATADETARLLGNHGKIVLVTASGSSQCVLPQIGGEVTQQLAKKPGLQLVATANIPLGDEDEIRFPVEKYRQLLDTYRDADAILTLAGPPDPAPSDLPAPRPKLIVVVAGSDPLAVKPLLENGFVDLAIVPRMRSRYDKKNPPKKARDWFDCQFQVVTPATVSQLAAEK